MAEFRIDLVKAKKTEHHLFFLRLPWALNNLLATVQVVGAIEESQRIPTEFKLHLKAYMLRLQQAHLVEACKSFIYSIDKTDSKGKSIPIRAWIKGNERLNKTYSELRKLIESPDYKRLRDFRDSMVFHYNHSDNSLNTSKALEKLAEHWNRFQQEGKSSLNLIVEGERYLLADHLLFFSWVTDLGFTDSDKAEARRMIKFQGKVLRQFIDFAEMAFNCWCDENKLWTNS